MKKYISFMLVILLGISVTAFGNNSGRNNDNRRPGNHSDRGNNNSRPGGNHNNSGNSSRPGNNNHNNTNDRNPGRNPGGSNNDGKNNNHGNNSVKICVEKRRNSDQCIRYGNYNGGGGLPSRPPKL
jgi:hypothetical protein